MASQFVSSYVSDLIERQRRLARRRFAGNEVGERVFQTAAVDAGYEAAVLLDARGRVLSVVPPKPGLVGMRISGKYAHLAAGVAGRVGISPVVPSASGMDDYLPKPLRPAQLDAVLERWVGPPGSLEAVAGGSA